MKIKKLSIATALISMILLSGCQQDNGKTKLTIGFWPESTETKDLAMYNEWKEAFEKDYPQYEIVGQQYTYDTTTVGAKFSTGTLPMVFQTWFTEPQKLVSKKYIRPITSQLKDLKWDTYMDEDMKDALTFNDDIYGVPRDGYGLGLLINIKTLGDNGLLPEDKDGNYVLYNEDGTPAYPTSFEQIKEVATTISEYDSAKGILVCSANKNGGWQFSNMVWNYGGELETQDESGKWVSNLASQEAIDALTWIQDMKKDDLLLNKTSVTYNDWYDSIESKVAMAIVGSDVLQLAQLNAGVNMDDLAFVPMPTGNGKDHYSLYGGTPYVFSADASDKEVEGILKFFEYVGRGPEITDISKAAMEKGNEVALSKNQPILPQIKPWTNEDYVTYSKQLEDKYVTVKMDYYKDFYNNINANKHNEVPYGAQEMYEYLDTAIQNVLSYPDTANPSTLLQTASSKLQSYLDKNVNK